MHAATLSLLNQVHTWFLEITFVQTYVSTCTLLRLSTTTNVKLSWNYRLNKLCCIPISICSTAVDMLIFFKGVALVIKCITSYKRLREVVLIVNIAAKKHLVHCILLTRRNMVLAVDMQGYGPHIPSIKICSRLQPKKTKVSLY